MSNEHIIRSPLVSKEDAKVEKNLVVTQNISGSSINIDEELKVGSIDGGTTKQDGMIWYENNQFNFEENGEQQTFESLIDKHIMKALEKQIKEHSTNSSITYVGEAEPGSSTSDPVWRIKVVVETGNDISVEWADGNGNFDNIFDDRETINYS